MRRLSVTVNGPKTILPSGTWAMPFFTSTWPGRSSTRWPSNRISPESMRLSAEMLLSKRGLAGAVRADESDYLALVDP